MTTERQINANRRNAQHSTGPRTPDDKAISGRNNTRHGFRSTTPIIPRLEDPDAWEHHRQTTVDGLAPTKALEETLAERVALILWRHIRIAVALILTGSVSESDPPGCSIWQVRRGTVPRSRNRGIRRVGARVAQAGQSPSAATPHAFLVT
jgi:acetyl-CoA acetyltransferase